MSQLKFKARLKRDTMEGINTVIEALLTKAYQADDDKLLMCALREINICFQKKLVDVQKECAISFTPTQAFALRILSTDYVHDKTSSIGNRLHQIANEVHKQYN